MAAIDFPDSPTIGDIFVAGNSSYQWTGTAWIANNLGALNYSDITNKPTELEDSAAIQSFVDGRIALTVDAAPDALNTLNELAASLADDADFAGTMTAALAGKAPISHSHAVSDVTGLQDALDAKKSEAVYEISADNTLLANSRYFVNTTATRTLTLPSSPAVGAEIWIVDQTGSSSTNNITVNNGGSLINGVSDTLVIDADGAIATLIYTGSTLGWRI